jgi:hypothetical protein
MSIIHRLCRSHLHRLMLLLFVWTLMGSQAVSAAVPTIRIAAGAGSFSFVDEKGDPSKKMTVYTYLPGGLKPDAAVLLPPKDR